MAIKFLEKIYDNRRSDSWSSNLRQKRLVLLTSLIESLPTPVKILDVGGRPIFWQNAGFSERDFTNLDITFINIESVSEPGFNCIVGDARDMRQFKDQEFDVVFSNSVIEHVGTYQDQHLMADEVRRVGKRYFVQTPNLFFPIEPHFLFPFFQFLPLSLRVWLLHNFDLGWYPKMADKQAARDLLSSTNLLHRKQVVSCFPEATIHEEKVLTMTKSFVAYSGW
ncbi:MAG: methyltransferase domain-containing protein [Waterburya sp.]